LVYVSGVVKHRGKDRVNLLVDSGATYTVLAESVWRGLEPVGEVGFIPADGTVVRRKVSEVLLELPGYGERHTVSRQMVVHGFYV
jgi:predicted aspartyl protease